MLNRIERVGRLAPADGFANVFLDIDDAGSAGHGGKIRQGREDCEKGFFGMAVENCRHGYIGGNGCSEMIQSVFFSVKVFMAQS